MKGVLAIHHLGFAVSLAAAPALGGCYVEDGPPPPQTVAYESPPPAPPPQVEVVTASPGPEYVWVGGYHRWNGRSYYWMRGHYERRPHRDAHYYPGHWEHRGRRQFWIEGRWQ